MFPVGGVAKTGFGANDFQTLLARRTLALNNAAYTRSLMRLASGDRIGRAADDPAGLVASESLRGTLAVLDAETSANQRAVNQAQTADGALGEISDLLVEAKSLVAANANDAGLSGQEKAANQMQIDSILSSVDRLSSNTSFSGRKLLDGTGVIAASGKALSIDSASTAALGKTESGSTTYTIADLRSGRALDGTTGNGELAAAVIESAISGVATARGRVGAFEKHTLQTRLAGIESARGQLSGALSILRDVDYAGEVSRNVRLGLMQQASLRMLGIASRSRGHMLSLLA